MQPTSEEPSAESAYLALRRRRIAIINSMDGKSKVLLIVTSLVIALSVAATFYRTVALEDFEMVYDEEAGEESDESSLEEDEADVIDE